MRLLDVVITATELPEHGLTAGDIGTLVEKLDDGTGSSSLPMPMEVREFSHPFTRGCYWFAAPWATTYQGSPADSPAEFLREGRATQEQDYRDAERT